MWKKEGGYLKRRERRVQNKIRGKRNSGQVLTAKKGESTRENKQKRDKKEKKKKPTTPPPPLHKQSAKTQTRTNKDPTKIATP